MSDKTTLTNAELELTQKIQLHFPRSAIPAEITDAWSGQKKEVITAVLLEVFGKLPRKPSILELLGTVQIPATTQQFIVRDRFVVNMNDDAPVKIWDLGDSFKKWFVGKIEEPFKGSTLRYAKLLQGSVDESIINDLGGEEKAETTLAEMFYLMEKQRNGEKGTLLINGWTNIFYIRDIDGVLRAVFCSWGGGGWGVAADPIDAPSRWFDDDQVLSRNSSES